MNETDHKLEKDILVTACLKAGVDSGVAGECDRNPRYARGYNDAVSKIEDVVCGFAEKMRFDQIAMKMKDAMNGRDRNAFLTLCLELDEFKPIGWTPQQRKNILRVLESAYDRLVAGSSIVGTRIPFGHATSYLLVIDVIGGKFDVRVEDNVTRPVTY